MNCDPFYKAALASDWDEIDGDFANHVELLDLSEGLTVKAHGARYGLVGFCCDASVMQGVGSLGAADAPEAIRAALQGLNMHSLNEVTFYDVGDVVCLAGEVSLAQDCLSRAVSVIKKHQLRPIVLGGGTMTTVGHYNGLMQINPCSRLSIVSFSACLSLQSGSLTGSRTSFWTIGQERKKAGLDFNYTCLGVQPAANASIEFEHAHENGSHYLTADVFQSQSQEDLRALLDDATKDSEAIFLSINLNVFASACAPGVVRPQPLGVMPWHVVPLLRYLCDTGKVAGVEILGLRPSHDREGLTAALAAEIIYQLI